MTKNQKPKKANPLFEILNGFCAKTPWEELSDEARLKYSQFMVNRFLCSYDYLIPLAEQLSTQRLDNESHYNILIDYVKHTKHYFKYDLWKGQDETDPLLLKAIMKQYNVGVIEAKRYNGILNDNQRKSILDKWSDFLAMSAEA